MNVRVTIHSSVDAVGGITNDPSSKWTLWRPPLVFFHVTASPTVIVTGSGENRLSAVVTTSTLAARAPGASRAKTIIGTIRMNASPTYCSMPRTHDTFG